LIEKYRAAVKKVRNAVRMIRKSPMKNDFLQDAVKKWQKRDQPLSPS
jgi:hypothetical protein